MAPHPQFLTKMTRGSWARRVTGVVKLPGAACASGTCHSTDSSVASSTTEFDDAQDTSSVDLANMDPEERQKLEEHWRQELGKVCFNSLVY